jgi:hypothetical protein
MRLKIFYGLASAALGLAFAAGLSTHARAAVPANYSQACKEVAASNDLIQKAVTRAGVAHRSARRTARRVNRRHAY